eukprot:CAMPEP_0115669498 /NCGR_PEP_ID=MMETSP0272-20121206/51030_1 /TAXON_ID=71861 /ORGANISM="Scrippsiella trochoidea, Strain CCMP3099" /LENGTH=277 /DNA_ID=CAMNT_0003108165 /DNA_START=30 /DNA_END=859 /DNA_ORIENTATION=+
MRHTSSLALLCALSAVALCSAQTVEEAAAAAALDYVERHEGEIGEVAREATDAQVKKNRPVLVLANASFEKALQVEAAATKEAVTAERKREATIVVRMQDTVSKATAAALPMVSSTAEEWARSHSLAEIYTIEKQQLDRLISEGQRAESNRQNATVKVEMAAATAVKMVALAREAQEVATHLRAAHAVARANTVKEQNDFAEAQAESSVRLSRLAQQVIAEANATASEALAQAMVVESKAEKALTTARSNTQRIQSLKLRAQKAFQQASGVAFVQRS